MIDDPGPTARFVYTAMAGIAGAITALYYRAWQTMSVREALFTVFVGMGFSIFAVPWLATDILRIPGDSLRAACALAYLGGTGANVLIPLLIERMKKRAGDTESRP